LRKRSTPAPPETEPAPRPHALRLRHTTPHSSALRRDASLSRCRRPRERPAEPTPPTPPLSRAVSREELGRGLVTPWHLQSLRLGGRRDCPERSSTATPRVYHLTYSLSSGPPKLRLEPGARRATVGSREREEKNSTTHTLCQVPFASRPRGVARTEPVANRLFGAGRSGPVSRASARCVPQEDG
jgi:hypothetical protein